MLELYCLYTYIEIADMSAGAFVRSRYQAEYITTQIHPIRVQPETISASIGGVTNAPPAGAQNNPISAKVSGSKRTLGLVARKIVIAAPTSSPPTGYSPGGKTTIPALTSGFYNAAIKGVNCTYLGATFQVVGRSQEYAN